MYFQTLSSGEQLKIILFLIPFAILDAVLKAFALWKSARRGQTVWFVALLIINSIGILPGVYLMTNVEKEKVK